MAHLLRINRNSTYTTLTATPYHVLNYTPAAPKISALEAVSEIENGGEVYISTRRNVTETIEILFSPSLPVIGMMSSVQDAIQALEYLMVQAEEYQYSKANYPIYLEFQPDGASSVWRSEILSGRLELESNAMSRWASGKACRGELIITRRWFWEGAEVELALAREDAAKATGGVTIYNHNDAGAGHGHWIEIAGADVTGSIPAPIRLEITNSLNAVTEDYDFFIGQGIFGGKESGIIYVLEVESDTPPGAGDTADAAYSGGYYHTSALTGTSASKRSWLLGNLYYFNGRFYRFLLRGLSSNAGVYAHIRIYLGAVLIWQGQEYELAAGYTLHDLGVMQLPPWLPEFTLHGGLDAHLYMRDATGATANIDLDCVFVMPADNFRVLRNMGTGLEYTTIVIDDGITDVLYVDPVAPGTRYTGQMVGYGSRPRVWPGITTRIYILSTGGTATTMDIARTKTVKAYYRPRRLTV